MDILNHIFLAAIWPSVAEDVSPQRAFNVDGTSMLLEASERADDNILYMAAGSKAKLKKMKLNPAQTLAKRSVPFKKRGVSLTVQTRGDGPLTTVIVKIKDRVFKNIKTIKVSDTLYSTCNNFCTYYTTQPNN